MNVDTKHPLLQNFLSDKSLGKHSLKNSLDQSSIASPEQKLLDMGLPHENSKNQSKKNKENEQKLAAKTKAQAIEKSNSSSAEKKLIERDPMKLLGIF